MVLGYTTRRTDPRRRRDHESRSVPIFLIPVKKVLTLQFRGGYGAPMRDFGGLFGAADGSGHADGSRPRDIDGR
ncbi:Uncharacterised protein [Mycobacteroides abscessus subsp. massiliense]|nr:Uncharacterised protein [Mycobacteroides abscessus subsp. massiliense]